jgi:nucleotide-binding universal stress UspA family protein
MQAESASKPVIVGVDGSEFSTAALTYAAMIAARLGARLEVITCVGIPDYLAVAYLESGGHPLTARLEDAAARPVEEILGRAFTGGRPDGVDVTVKFGPPAKVLVEESRRAQLLVIGRHGEGRFPGTSMGSVSKACAARSACPVVLVGQEADNV